MQCTETISSDDWYWNGLCVFVLRLDKQWRKCQWYTKVFGEKTPSLRLFQERINVPNTSAWNPKSRREICPLHVPSKDQPQEGQRALIWSLCPTWTIQRTRKGSGYSQKVSSSFDYSFGRSLAQRVDESNGSTEAILPMCAIG
jgi:hypothetical protein